MDASTSATDPDPAGQVKFKQSRPTGQTARGEHNRPKQYLIPENVPCPFLVEIGVMTPEGKVKANHYKKFRQINRYLELVNDVVPDLPKTGRLKVVDFGCGRRAERRRLRQELELNVGMRQTPSNAGADNHSRPI